MNILGKPIYPMIKHAPSPVLVILLICTFFACSKNATTTGQDPSTIDLTDSSGLLSIKWNLIKDSSTNIGDYYFMENGTAYYPTPGIYWGVAGDYFDFKTDGTVSMHANNHSYTSTYKLYTGNKLVIEDMLVHDTGRVVQLTSSAAILEWSNTSPNDGQYFRRTYLQK